MDTAEADKTPLSQPINPLELDPKAVQAECPVDPTLRGPYPTAAKAKQKEPAAVQPQYRAGEYVPPAAKQDNVNFVSRSTQMKGPKSSFLVLSTRVKGYPDQISHRGL